MSMTLSGDNGVTFPNNTTQAAAGVIPGPTFYAYSTGSYTAAQGSNSLVSVNTKVFDTGTCFNNTGSSTTLNGVTAPAYSFAPNVPGYYQFNFGMQGNTASGGTSVYWLPFLYKNGSLYAFGTSYLNGGNGNTPSCTGSMLIYMNGTSDYVQLYLGTNNGGTFTASNQGNNWANWFSAVLVRGV